MKVLQITFKKAPDYETTGSMDEVERQEIEVPGPQPTQIGILVALLEAKGYISILEAMEILK